VAGLAASHELIRPPQPQEKHEQIKEIHVLKAIATLLAMQQYKGPKMIGLLFMSVGG